MKIEVYNDEEIEAYNENKPPMVNEIDQKSLERVATEAIHEYINNRWIDANKEKYADIIRAIEGCGHTVEVRPTHLVVNEGLLIGFEFILGKIDLSDGIIISMDHKAITFKESGEIKMKGNGGEYKQIYP